MYNCHRKAHEPLSIATVTLTIEGGAGRNAVRK